MSTSSIPRGPGLFEITDDDGDRAITNIRKLAGGEVPPGRVLVNAAAVLLGVLDLGLFAVSLAAQYQYIFHAKHQSWPAVIEAVALDAGMIIFSLLALGLARGGQSARVERALILVCASGSAAMNYAAADVSSARSVAAYVMPPVFLAIVTDRVIAVVRRHVLGMEAERSAWAALGRAALVVLAVAGKAVLYGCGWPGPRSTLGGLRRCVLRPPRCPLPRSCAGAARPRRRSSWRPGRLSRAVTRTARAGADVPGQDRAPGRRDLRPAPALHPARAGGPAAGRDEEGAPAAPVRRPPRLRRPGSGQPHRLGTRPARPAQRGHRRAYIYSFLDPEEAS